MWFDEFELSIGDSLNDKINYGLSQSRYGIVVISPSFFTKRWAQHEMSGLIARQLSGAHVILPIWHRITKNEIIDNAPPLADIVSLNSSTQSMEEIVARVVERVVRTESFRPRFPNRRSGNSTHWSRFRRLLHRASPYR